MQLLRRLVLVSDQGGSLGGRVELVVGEWTGDGVVVRGILSLGDQEVDSASAGVSWDGGLTVVDLCELGAGCREDSEVLAVLDTLTRELDGGATLEASGWADGQGWEGNDWESGVALWARLDQWGGQ